MRQVRDSPQTFTYCVIILPANGHPVRADAYSGGSPCRHQCAPGVWPVAGAATASAITATVVRSVRMVRMLAWDGIRGIRVEPQPRCVSYRGSAARHAPPASVAIMWMCWEVTDLHRRFGELVALGRVGFQQRIRLAVALVHEPELLVLDEPFAGVGSQ